MKPKKLTSIVVLCLTSMVCQAQSYFINNTWTEYIINTQYNSIISKSQYWTANDTVMNGKSYRKIVDKDGYLGAIREENGKVYARLDYGGYHYASNEFMLYDFTVQVGDIIESTALEGVLSYPDGITVREIDEIELESGEKRKRFFFNETDEWIEGIGSVNGLFHDAMSQPTNYNVSYLVCFQNNDVPLYVNIEKCWDGKCCENLPLRLDNPDSHHKSVCFPNPTQGIVKIVLPESNGEKSISIKIVDSMGEMLQASSASNKESVEIDLSGYASAIYYIAVDIDNSSTLYKVIKQ
ncbi:MAG: T9SS type A sorting domain-containing protein [Dysgonamonadaceae bacterium]|jgi:hypothetical protein|nr:T9SS type A sorting domain-containing protein [Dysgonamonadaceae bacterium]